MRAMGQETGREEGIRMNVAAIVFFSTFAAAAAIIIGALAFLR